MQKALLALTLIGCVTPGADDYDHSRERDVLGGKADNPAPRKQWTLLFYGAGDNNLGDEIVQAVNKLESVGSTADVNLIAFYDHTTLGAARVYVEKDSDLTKITSPGILQLGAVDSGIPQTLITFASWAIENYPAEHYALIIDGHGQTAPQLIAPDETTMHSMTLTDLWQAIDYIRQRSHRQLGVLGGDTCLTQTVEQAFELADDANQIAMSENLDYGWAYDQIAKGLVDDPAQSDAALAKLMVDKYSSTVTNASITMSAIDTAKVRDVAVALDALAVALRPYVESSPLARTTFDAAVADSYRPPFGESYVDVQDFVAQVKSHITVPDITAAADTLAARAQAATGEAFASPDLGGRAHGLSVFLPQMLTEDNLAAYRVSRFAHASTWDELVAWLRGYQ